MIAACTAALLLAGQAQAQTIYRTLGADGSVTFTDKPPAVTDNSTALSVTGRPMTASAGALPAEVREVAGKYPVTLYTSVNCAPCDLGRKLLNGRGIPFAEKTISTVEDTAALQRISGENSLPFVTIGGQQIKGFSDSEWTQFLDAAGYPKFSVLPASYRNPPAAPLVVLQKAEPIATPEDSPARAAAPGLPVDATSNPAGIKF